MVDKRLTAREMPGRQERRFSGVYMISDTLVGVQEF
jgi:hypothetical protein